MPSTSFKISNIMNNTLRFSKSLSIKVVLFGYGQIGVYGLKCLKQAKVEVVGVLPRASDRSVDTSETSFYNYARQAGLHIFDAIEPNDKNLIMEIETLAPDYLLILQHNRIIKKPLICIPRLGCLNMHFAPLPRLRGCFPSKWSIINNEDTGVTLHYIDPGIDTGNIIFQETIKLSQSETDESLYGKLLDCGKIILDNAIPRMAKGEQFEGLAQNHASSSYYPKDIPFGGKIDWTKDAQWIERFIRAFTFPPYPAAIAETNSITIQIRGPLDFSLSSELKPGEFRNGGGSKLLIGCGQGHIIVESFIYNGIIIPGSDLPKLCSSHQFKF